MTSIQGTIQPVPVTVLCGFLGSGKTTLLRRWRLSPALRDAAVIVHDLSDFGLDAEIISGEDAAPESGKITGRVAALHGRHARELLSESLASTLESITRLHPPVSAVLVESTGAARPWPLIAALTQNPAFHLRHFIVTVDALNLHRDWEDGAALDAQSIADPALRAAAAVLVEQARFAGIIVLTKNDTVPKAASQRMIHHLRQLNPRAAIALSSHAGLQLEQLESIAPPRLDRLKGLAEKLGLTAPGAAATAADVDCLIFKDRRPFHPRRLWDCCRSQMGTGLYRTKGFLWLASRPGQVLLWQQAGSQISFELMGLWRAELALNRDGKLLPEEVAHLRQLLESEDAVFGDRHIEMTLIGLPEARESFARSLRECLCTDAEVEAWQRGATFEDPWPVTLRRTA